MITGEERRRVFEAELSDIDEKIEKLNAQRNELIMEKNFLHKKLDLPLDENIPISEGGFSNPAPIKKNVGDYFKPGDFFNCTIADAARRVLEKSSEAMTLKEVFDVLMSKDFSIGGNPPIRNLYVSMARSSKIVLVAKNTFDLASRRGGTKKNKKGKKVDKKNPVENVENNEQNADSNEDDI